MKFHLLLISLLYVLGLTDATAQLNKASKAETTELPVWIKMMDDSMTNYFEAEKAFEKYWSVRPIPIEEDEIIGHTELKKEERSTWLQRVFSAKKERMKEDSERYSFEYKKFKNWERAVLPYVQDDGSILTPYQRIEIWKNERVNKN